MAVGLYACLDVVEVVVAVAGELLEDVLVDGDLVVTDDYAVVGLPALVLLHPWVLSYLLYSVALVWFIVENLLYQISAFIRYAMMELIAP